MKMSAFVISLVLVACASQKNISVTAPPPASLIPDGKLFTAFYQQKAAEYDALCFQAYNFAINELDRLPAKGQKQQAIITDIDETVLDNSPYAVHQALHGKDYEPATWYQWTDRAEADTVPGAPQFLKLAAAKGIEIFYITNRDERERAATLQNLRKYNLPFTDNAHLILKTDSSSKESRRSFIRNNYEVVMLVGDNLADFSSDFDKKNVADRDASVRNNRLLFGTRWIVLPNPNYGDWEGAYYKDRAKTLSQKDSLLRATLRNY